MAEAEAVGYYFVKKPANCTTGDIFHAVVDGGTRVAITCAPHVRDDEIIRFRMPVMDIPHRLYRVKIPDNIIPGNKFTVKLDDNVSQLCLTCPLNFDVDRTFVIRLPM